MYTLEDLTMKLLAAWVAFAALAVFPAFANDDGPYQIKYISNLAIGDSYVNVSNSGAVQGQNLQGQPFGPAQIDKNGDLCINIYVFSPDEQEQECCSCLLTANGLATFSARADLTSNPLTGRPLNDVVIKIVATASCIPQLGGMCFPQSVASNCDAATAGLQPTFDTSGFLGGNDLMGSSATGQPVARAGLLAWGTALHANTSTFPPGFQDTETRFSVATLSDGELNRITGLCSNIEANGSGSGICSHNHGLCVSGLPPSLR
jgi:hypothetical protein